MSELKAISGHEIREDIDYNTRGIDPEDKELCKYGKELCNTLYYRKSEADKVIENRDKEIANLKDSIGKLLKSKTEQVMDEVFRRCLIYGDGFVPVEHAMRLVAELRHHKYKRCLAMAKVCFLRFVRYENYLQKLCASNATIEAYKFRMDMYDKWEKRWLKLAEKFKGGR